MSPSIKTKLGSSRNSSMFSLLPVAKLSRQTTWLSLLSNASHKFEPINPAPPVIKILFLVKFIFFFLFTGNSKFTIWIFLFFSMVNLIIWLSSRLSILFFCFKTFFNCLISFWEISYLLSILSNVSPLDILCSTSTYFGSKLLKIFLIVFSK